MAQVVRNRVMTGTGKNVKGGKGLTPFSHLPYSRQLEKKQENIRQILGLLVRKLKNLNSSIIPDENGLPCLVENVEPSPLTQGYRNTDDFSIWPGDDGNPKTVGYVLGKYNESRLPICVPPHKFSIVKDSHKSLASSFQSYLRKCSPFDVCTDFGKGGHWRRLTVRSNDFDELMGVAILHPQNLSPDHLKEEHDRLINFFSPIALELTLKSLYFQACPGVRCTHARAPFKLLMGSDHIDEIINGVKIRITPEPFIQINKGAAEILYKRIIEEIEPDSNMTVLDMCCGSGVLSLQLAHLVKEVIGVDSCEQSIHDAKINAQVNGVTNCRFIHGTIEDHLVGLSENLYSDNLVMVVNPGSTGLLSGVINVIRTMSNVSKLIYVTCKPEGQALKNFAHLSLPFRPMDDIQGDGFIPVKAIPVDIFPQTDRCELIVTFSRY